MAEDLPKSKIGFGGSTTIGLEGARFRAPIGYYEEEQLTGNEFIIDVFVQTDASGAGYTDDLGGTVNYQTIYWLVQSEVKKPAQLIESLAQRIVDRIEKQFEQVSGVKLKVTKLHPPLGGEVRAASVEMKTGTFGDGGGFGPLGGLDLGKEEDTSDGGGRDLNMDFDKLFGGKF